VTALVVRNAAGVIAWPDGGALRADRHADAEVLEGVAVTCERGEITSVGPSEAAEVSVDASGCTVVPGFVDAHTHLPFCGWRADEDAARLSGLGYEALHRAEGGIYRSARLLAEASDDEVLAFCEPLVASMLRHGTTSFEMKSGYGLSVEAEVRQLRLARSLSERAAQQVAVTCLAAHAVPRGRSAGEWVGEAADALLPRVASEDLAGACDVYVESIAFALEHAARLAETAAPLGLKMRVHADQLEDSQAGSFAARGGFATADHLNHTSLEAVSDLAESDTAAVLLPGATFTLRQARHPPARALIERGAIVALGSDFNPGTSPLHSMPLVMALACRLYGLRPLEALAGATVNAAFALGLEDLTGRIAPGYRADLVVLDAPSFEHLVYRADRDHVAAVVCGGELAYVAPGFEHRIED
jgi:imidazolonepropionase